MILSLNFEHLMAISTPHWNPVQHISMAGGSRNFQYPHSISLWLRNGTITWISNIAYRREYWISYSYEFLRRERLEDIKLCDITLITSWNCLIQYQRRTLNANNIRGSPFYVVSFYYIKSNRCFCSYHPECFWFCHLWHSHEKQSLNSVFLYLC